MDITKLLETIVALVAALSWPLIVLFLVLFFGTPLKKFLGDVGEFTFKASASGLEATAKRQELSELQRVAPATQTARAAPGQKLPETTEQRVNHREDIYKHNRGVFLVHILEPSKDPGQKFDIFIYLIKHQSSDLSDIDYAEFFFGRFWGNQIFKVVNQGRLLGISTSAFGSFLCTCRVVFKDGHEVILDRYIDFEMGNIMKS